MLDGPFCPEVRLLLEVMQQAIFDLQSTDGEARREAHLFFTARSGGWAESRRIYLDALGIDESCLLRSLGLELQPGPATTPAPVRRPSPRRRYTVTPKERRAPTIPREAILSFVAQHDHVTAGDLVERFGMSIQVAAARLNGYWQAELLERPSRGIYRIARPRTAPTPPSAPTPLAARLLDALRDAEHPDGLTVREMAWATGANPVSIYEVLKRLKDEGVLIHEKPRWSLAQSTP